MKNVSLCIFLVFLLSCNEEKSFQQNGNCENLSINELTSLLNNNIEDIKTPKNFITKKIEIEEEGVEWDALEFYFNNDLIYLAETNWENKTKINRITIYGKCFKDEEFFVGQNFGKIKHLITEEIPNMPDGYLFLNLKKNKTISLEFNISKNKDLYYGISSLKNIPDSLKIKAIIINN